MSVIRLVCAECGNELRTISLPDDAVIGVTLKIDLCYVCSQRLVDTATTEAIEDKNSDNLPIE